VAGVIRIFMQLGQGTSGFSCSAKLTILQTQQADRRL
jgi:hypothetical protein